MSSSNPITAPKLASFLPGPCPLHSNEGDTHYCGLDLEETIFMEVSIQGNHAMLQEFLNQLWTRPAAPDIICINRVYEDAEGCACCPTRQSQIRFLGKIVPADLHRQAWELGLGLGIFEDDKKCSECIRKVIKSLIRQI
ncbi:MAG: hypothetical protein ACFFBD_22870 [Candidatus Hodarchaeota archaeon]